MRMGASLYGHFSVVTRGGVQPGRPSRILFKTFSNLIWCKTTCHWSDALTLRCSWRFHKRLVLLLKFFLLHMQPLHECEHALLDIPHNINFCFPSFAGNPTICFIITTISDNGISLSSKGSRNFMAPATLPSTRNCTPTATSLSVLLSTSLMWTVSWSSGTSISGAPPLSDVRPIFFVDHIWDEIDLQLSWFASSVHWARKKRQDSGICVDSKSGVDSKAIYWVPCMNDQCRVEEKSPMNILGWK